MNPDKGFAFTAFLLALTALWLPWWRVSWDDGATVVRDGVSAFRPEPLTTSWGPWLTGVLAAAAALLLFVRLAAGSRTQEPAAWRRDLAVAAGLLAAAALSCLLWPAAEAVPSFWGGRTYAADNATGPSITETAMPGLGWWLSLLAAILLAIAAWTARKQAAEGAEDPSTALDTSRK